MVIHHSPLPFITAPVPNKQPFILHFVLSIFHFSFFLLCITVAAYPLRPLFAHLL